MTSWMVCGSPIRFVNTLAIIGPIAAAVTRSFAIRGDWARTASSEVRRLASGTENESRPAIQSRRDGDADLPDLRRPGPVAGGRPQHVGPRLSERGGHDGSIV